MTRTVILWALGLAAGAFVLQWLQYRWVVHAVPGQVYVALIAAAFLAGGIWMGFRLKPNHAPPPFARNDRALSSLGLTGQEVKVLERLAEGRSNKEIARVLGLSPNTVKTHLANLFAKLDVSRRTQAIGKARELGLIP